MSGNRLGIARRLPRFQFSILNVLVLTAAVAVCLGLMKVNLPLGVMAAILMLGTWWAAIAVAHALHKTAFVLAALSAGVLWYLALSIPFSFTGLMIWSAGHWPDLALLACFCVASLLTGLVLRPWLDGEQLDFSVWNTVAPSYVMGLLFLTVWNLCTWLEIPDCDAPGFSVEVLLAGVMVVTLSLHIGAPVGMVLLELLRDVEKTAIDVGRAQEDVVEALEILLALGRCPISGQDVARQAGCDLATTEHFLKVLTRSGHLEWSAEEGYRRRLARGG